MKSVGVDSSDLSRRVGVRVDFKSLESESVTEIRSPPQTFQGSVVGVVVDWSRQF